MSFYFGTIIPTANWFVCVTGSRDRDGPAGHFLVIKLVVFAKIMFISI